MSFTVSAHASPEPLRMARLLRRAIVLKCARPPCSATVVVRPGQHGFDPEERRAGLLCRRCEERDA